MKITKGCSRCNATESTKAFSKSVRRCDECRAYDKRRYDGAFTTGGVYVFKDANDEVVYVGASRRVGRRIKQHFGVKKGATETFAKHLNPLQRQVKYRWEVVTKTADPVKLREVERLLIQEFKPIYNTYLKGE